MSKTFRAVVLFADGFEEVEAVTPLDFLRRAGVRTDAVGVTDRDVIGSHDIRLTTDYTLDQLEDDVEFDVVVLPGGLPGSNNLAADLDVQRLLRRQFAAGRLVAAICAAPAVVLGSLGLLEGRRWTSYPGQQQAYEGVGEYCSERVVRDGNLITSRGAGSSAEFACEIIRALLGDEAAHKIHSSTLQKD